MAGTIAEQHHHLRTLLTEIEAADATAVPALILELKDALEKHFADEEAPGAFDDIVRTNAANVSPRLVQLFREHAYILRKVNALAGDPDPRARDVLRLVQAIRLHETNEMELLTDALYDDHGGSG